MSLITNYDEAERYIRLLAELRPQTVVGLMELRNSLSQIFPEFSEIRDSELDDLIIEIAKAALPSEAELG